ncbi:MAG: DUF6036 family nucleotidyltransferase [Verrucomicrobiota bacterium]
MEHSFERLLVALVEGNVRFIIVGGLAVSLNGYVRLTEDVDFVVDAQEDNVRNLIETLRSFGEGFGGALTLEDFPMEPGAIRVIEPTADCQMDIFTLIGGYSYEDLIEAAESTTIAKVPFRYASRQQIIDIKSSSVREKDRLDIAAMKRLMEDPGAFD